MSLSAQQRIRVLIVDDSALIRNLLTRFLSSDPKIEVVGTASDPYVAREKLVQLKPDVMTLDIEMPRMDGVTFLEKVMEHFPTRTIVISSLSTRGSESALRALEAGAIDVMAKPAIDVTKSLVELGAEIVMRVKNTAGARLLCRSRTNEKNISVLSRSAPPFSFQRPLTQSSSKVLAIASSTGGTEALKTLLPMLPSDLPGTVIVQHMPPGFTKKYAEHLQAICPFEVREAKDGDTVNPGLVLLAPGNFHMQVVKKGTQYFVGLNQDPLLHGVRPAADILMKSVAKIVGKNAIGVVLTGMGKDGAEGLLAMKQAGSFNIAQDEETCVVFGMPKVAIDLGAINQVIALEQIAAELIHQFKTRSTISREPL